MKKNGCLDTASIAHGLDVFVFAGVNLSYGT